jgi:hypothetical protein
MNEGKDWKIGQGGDLELQRRNMHGTNSVICSANLLRAGARVKLEQAPQGATRSGPGWIRWPQVDRKRSTISERSRGCRVSGANCFLSVVTTG